MSKTQSALAIRALAEAGQRRFGENYVQEAISKQSELSDLELEWHLIGHLQSNKAALAAAHFDWVHSVDRAKLVTSLGAARPAEGAPLNVLIQVDIDAEASKSGCRPDEVPELAELIQQTPTLRLRGLMAIPNADADIDGLTQSFRSMRRLQDDLASRYDGIDTLSMGMSGDFELAIAEGANLVRIGTALFGPRRRASPND